MADNHRRFGGLIQEGGDPLASFDYQQPRDTLLFSTGRAAISWLVQTRGPFHRAFVCAYTWPVVPKLLEQLGLKVTFFDVDPTEKMVVDLVDRVWLDSSRARVLILLPALFGYAPKLNIDILARELGTKALILVDGAQTAFGVDWLPLPTGGAILSCPHKATTLGDGAMLRLSDMTPAERASVEALPEATEARDAKLRARALLATGNPEDEPAALSAYKASEDLWPNTPCRMSELSRSMLARIDVSAHESRRRDAAGLLRRRFGEHLPPAYEGTGVPFCYPALISRRAALMNDLHSHRVFATTLWPDARVDSRLQPRAANMSRYLVGLPIDQRYAAPDYESLAQTVLSLIDEQDFAPIYDGNNDD